jgi:hypothetical protein
MRVYDINPSNKGLVAFEINASLGRRRATRVVSGIPGVRILRRPRLFARLREEVFCEFELKHHRFNIWQPLGNSSRYWIGASNGTSTSVLLQVRQAFIDYQFRGFHGFARWTRQGKGTL